MIGVMAAALFAYWYVEPHAYENPSFSTDSPVFATLKVSGPFSRMATLIEIRAAPAEGRRRRGPEWIATAVFQLGEKMDMWTDSRRCPALVEVVKSLGAMPTFTVAAPQQDERPPPLDGATYEVSVRGRVGDADSRMTFTSYGSSAVGDLVEKSRDALSNCWVKGLHPDQPPRPPEPPEER